MITALFAHALTAMAALGAGQAQAPTEPPAAVRRPNLQVLTKVPESQLFLLMNVLADSLGVRCEYCHVQTSPDLTRTPANVGGWVWDSDDKPQKRTAREMMRMVIDVNTARFKGESRITCYTCHRGSTQAGRTPPLPPAADGSRPATAPPLPSADRVWTSYTNAVGQAVAAAPGRATIISGWDDRSEGRYGKVEIVVAGANRYRATVTTPATTSSQGLDGDVGWIATNDRVQQLSAPDVDRLRRIATRYHPIKERPANLQIVGIERLGDHEVYVGRATLDPITTRTLYFDVVTGLLRRETTTTETMLLPLQEQIDYDDYRAVNGVQMPFRVRTSDGAPYDTVMRTFLQIRRDVAVDDALFRPPSAPR